MDKKRTLLCGLAIIGVCILAVVILLIFNRTTEREATPEELEAYAHYVVDWQSLPIAQEGMTDKEIILSLCTYSQEEVIGENKHLNELHPIKLAVAGVAGALGGAASSLIADAVIGLRESMTLPFFAIADTV